MLGLQEYFYRLVPANPILLRVVQAAGKRRRDLLIRSGYLGLLIAVVVFYLMTSGQTVGSSDLSVLAAASGELFVRLSYLQLALVTLLAPVFTAGAITQEKDSQTYDILLTTPLTNGQIVLGSLLSRLFFIIALLVSGIPVFAITQIFGGVAIKSIATAFGIASATAFVTGALAMAIATFKVGTRRTIFSFYLCIVVYLVGLFLLDKVPFFHPVQDYEKIASSGQYVVTEAGSRIPIYAKTSYFTAIHPFLAMRSTFGSDQYAPPLPTDAGVVGKSWLASLYLTRPAAFYIWFMFTLSLLLVAPSIVLLRRMAQSTSTLRGWILTKLHISKGDRTRKPRGVWNNPIAWREAKTKASAARASVLRYGFILLGILGALVLVWLHGSEVTPDRYIARDGFDPATGALTVVDDDRVVVYQVVPGTQVMLNGVESDVNALLGRRRVEKINGSATNSQIVDSILLHDIERTLSTDQARNFLLGALIVEFAAILLIVTNAAASAVTREKEDGSLDLLLTTPITSRYYIWGKLRGLVSFVLPLVAVPVISVLMFIMYDIGRYLVSPNSREPWVVLPEAVLVLPGTLVIVAAFASMLGMQMSLRFRTTVMAVMTSVGIVVGACFGLGFCGFSILGARGMSHGALIFSSFSPFTLVSVLINPYTFAENLFKGTTTETVATARMVIFVFGWIATGAYTLVVWAMYKSMVKNFDMTIRRQSR